MASIRRPGEAADAGLDLLPVDPEDDSAVIVNSAVPAAESPSAALPPDLLDAPVGMDDLSYTLAARPPRRHLPGLTALLTAAVLIAGGFLGGVVTQKHRGAAASTATTAAAGAAAYRRAAGTTGGAGAGAAAGAGGTGTGAAAAAGGAGGAGVTVGTVKLVDGNTVYLTATDGSIVKVTTGPSTTVNVTKKGTAGDLRPGTTVIVQGAAGADGVVKATSVSQGAAGGFGAGGYGGGGYGGGTRTGGTGTRTGGTGAGGAGG